MPNYGKMVVISGPMYAGKTSEMLKQIFLTREFETNDIEIFKPTFDNRYSETEIVSHNGLRSKAKNIDGPVDPEELTKFIFVDEVQFLDESRFNGDFIQWVKNLLDMGINVTVSGLNQDWQGNSFDITAKLMAMADHNIHLSAYCSTCGKPALKTYKKSLGGGSVELGATESYESRCNEHWTYKK